MMVLSRCAYDSTLPIQLAPDIAYDCELDFADPQVQKSFGLFS